ncbi:hypothetical protein TcG_00920 [Trypanosoma cruzi]|nr:hypothetical protein TcG_00920 [Trypanosoma cruzi]
MDACGKFFALCQRTADAARTTPAMSEGVACSWGHFPLPCVVELLGAGVARRAGTRRTLPHWSPPAVSVPAISTHPHTFSCPSVEVFAAMAWLTAAAVSVIIFKKGRSWELLSLHLKKDSGMLSHNFIRV